MPHIVYSSSYALLVVAAVFAGGALIWLRSRPQDPAEAERQRRLHLNRVGRIVEGQVLEVIEQAAPAADARPALFLRRRKALALDAIIRSRTLVFYSYHISGVSYETAQDVSGLEERACIRQVVTGQPASVKYDPANPGNSILVADDWSGLR